VTIFSLMLTTTCFLAIAIRVRLGLELGFDLVSDWLFVVHAYTSVVIVTLPFCCSNDELYQPADIVVARWQCYHKSRA